MGQGSIETVFVARKRESRRGVKFTTNKRVPVRRYLLPGKRKSIRGQTHNMGQGSIETVFVSDKT